ncbi:maker163 [Drosophila busckii]|uniref:Maker163 n=1 Tax=Drosophila busckii TaxID=30019 RepID=A0A0M3QXB1_DROBS|nr:neuropeptide CCHamide-1 [Drosophila busckii]ALC45559.1 maker163 [Drosophila busckii]
MWYFKCSWAILIFLVLFTLVRGSCLEYGHSCWGAHGKRSGNRAAIAAKQPYVNKLAEQLYNNGNALDDDNSSNNNNNNNNNSNKKYDLPLTLGGAEDNTENTATMPVMGAEQRNREFNAAKWTQLLRQQRFQLQQLQRQFDASDAADSWRKLQQAMAEAEQHRQQQHLPMAEIFEVTN